MNDLGDFDPDGGSNTDTDEQADSHTDTQHTVSESADKIVLKADVKRGNGTRDQDKINVKCKGNDPADTAAKLADTLDALAAEGVATTLRETQPEDNDE